MVMISHIMPTISITQVTELFVTEQKIVVEKSFYLLSKISIILAMAKLTRGVA